MAQFDWDSNIKHYDLKISKTKETEEATKRKLLQDEPTPDMIERLTEEIYQNMCSDRRTTTWDGHKILTNEKVSYKCAIALEKAIAHPRIVIYGGLLPDATDCMHHISLAPPSSSCVIM